MGWASDGSTAAARDGHRSKRRTQRACQQARQLHIAARVRFLHPLSRNGLVLVCETTLFSNLLHSSYGDRSRLHILIRDADMILGSLNSIVTVVSGHDCDSKTSVVSLDIEAYLEELGHRKSPMLILLFEDKSNRAKYYGIVRIDRGSDRKGVVLGLFGHDKPRATVFLPL